MNSWLPCPETASVPGLLVVPVTVGIVSRQRRPFVRLQAKTMVVQATARTMPLCGWQRNRG